MTYAKFDRSQVSISDLPPRELMEPEDPLETLELYQRGRGRERPPAIEHSINDEGGFRSIYAPED